MKTIKQFIVPALAVLMAGTTNAQNIEVKNEKVHIKLIHEVNGNTTVIDTIIDADKVHTLHGANHELADFHIRLPELMHDTTGTGSKKRMMKKVIVTDSGNGPDTVIFKECRDVNDADAEKEMKALGIEMKHMDKGENVIIFRKELTEKGDSLMHFKHVLVKRVVLDDATETERKSQGKNLSGDNKLNVEHLNFFPNPNNGKFSLTFSLKEKGTTTVTIYNTEGKKVYEEALKDFSGSYEKTIDISGSPNGIYFLNVQQGKNNLVKKIVIQ